VVLKKAATFVKTARTAFQTEGYSVQSVRIATDALQSASSPEEAAQLAARLDRWVRGLGLRFLSLGCTSDETLPLVLPEILRNTEIASCSFAWQEVSACVCVCVCAWCVHHLPARVRLGAAPGGAAAATSAWAPAAPGRAP
jgi:hypothetical protein